MGHSYSSCLVHYVFSTKNRRRSISPELRDRLWPYLGGIAREKGMKGLAVGGTDDHVHMLVSVPPAISISKAIQLIKGGSSKWIHETFASNRTFAWQEGYGAFSIGISAVEETMNYIEAQEQHHETRTFEEEYVAFLKRHGIEYDERHVWG